MLHPAIIFISCLPLLLRIVPSLLPAAILEPYTLLNPEELNRRPGETEATTKWMNMGWWEGTDVFADANEALAKKLLDFAAVKPGGRVLDIAHGPGESLSLHLAQTPPPSHLHALTSRPSDTQFAKELVSSRHGTTITAIEWYTSSASHRPGQDADHPLNPMKGFLGKVRDQQPWDGEHDQDVQTETSLTDADRSPPPYDLVYILDGIYHFPPSLPHFLSTVLLSLAPGTGVVAYTDILPPPDLSALLRLVLSPLLSVPPRNLVKDRGRPLTDYEDGLRKLGFEDVKIEDWSQGVWGGFARFLRSKGGLWNLVGGLVEKAETSGWKFVAVRGRRAAV